LSFGETWSHTALNLVSREGVEWQSCCFQPEIHAHTKKTDLHSLNPFVWW
jgi:hypothetical protein